MVDEEHRECPFCAEVIKKKAVLCRYCKSDLPVLPNRKPNKSQPKSVVSSARGPGEPRHVHCKTCAKKVYFLTVKNGECADCRRKKAKVNEEAIRVSQKRKSELQANLIPWEIIKAPCQVCEKSIENATLKVFDGCCSYECAKTGREKARKEKAILENPTGKIVCPHCQEKGMVTVHWGKVKTGFSTGKASFSVVTLGLSTLFTGLAKKESVKFGYCQNCSQDWKM